MGEFSPVQLDALEDALEDLELSGIPDALESDSTVSERLSEYRGLLQLSREAFPTVEVPSGALDGVLAMAREETAQPAAAAPTPAEEAQPWWKRISLWVPVLAVGASAALVLVLVRPMLSGSEPEASAVASAERADSAKDDDVGRGQNEPKPLLEEADALQAAADPRDEDVSAQLGGVQEMRGRLRGSAATDLPGSVQGGLDDGAAAEDAEAEEEAMPEEEPAPTDKIVYDRSSAGKKGASKSRPKAKSGLPSSGAASTAKPAKPAPEPQKAEEGPSGAGSAPPPRGTPSSDDEPESSTDRSAALTGAERERKAGRCSAARPVYTDALDDTDASVRAKALAGLGLCALAAGDTKGAEGYFTRAKKTDASIGPFIARERRVVEAQSL